MNLPSTRQEARQAGSKHYFTGKPCKFGNVAERLVSAGICRCADCKKQYAERSTHHWRANPERRKANCARWRALNPERASAYSRDYKAQNRSESRARHLKREYGITLEFYAQMLEAQGGCCAICSIKAEDAPRKILFVDHCHTTHRVRGLLCDHCNKSLGVIEKYRAEIPKMLAYADEGDAQVRGLQQVIEADRLP